MDLGLKGRTALVTGASSGLGLATAEALAAEGANVSMFARRRDVLEREADRIGALAVRGDVSIPSDLERAVETTVKAFGGIDVLVWNSGGPTPGPATAVTPETLEQAIEMLFMPAVRLFQLCLPHLEASAGGRIVAITSLAAKEPTDQLALSNAIRPGLTGWMKTLARELGPKGITVNCVAPGRIATARLDELYPGGPTEADLREIPLRRWGDPREFGDVVCFLASDRARYVTGQTVVVDGGLQRSLFSGAPPLTSPSRGRRSRARRPGGARAPPRPVERLPAASRQGASRRAARSRAGRARSARARAASTSSTCSSAARTCSSRSFPFIHSGATLVPAKLIVPPGVSDTAQRSADLREMTVSQKIAARGRAPDARLQGRCDGRPA